MPAKWTPTTSIVVHIKHIDDRPAYIDEEVCIFKDNVDGQGAWNDKKLDKIDKEMSRNSVHLLYLL